MGAFSSAGWLVQVLTAPVAVLVDAVSFLFSAAFVWTIRKPETHAVPHAEREGVRREIARGLRTIVHDPVLLAMARSQLIVDFSFRVFGAVFLIYVTREVGFRPGVLGVIFAVGGVSSLAGAVLATRSALRFGVGPSMSLGVAMMGLSMLFVPLAHEVSVLAAGFLVAQQFCGDGGYTVYEVNSVSLRQSITPGRLLGRVTSGMRISSLAAMLIGALVGGTLGETVGLRATLVVAAAGVIIAGAWLMASPVWGVRRTPVEAVEVAAEA